ncbi:hypothetical protein [Pseudotabrizicola sp. L79]|uniref:hypothetical protein n=1 Tax=Pseudotabrizicola sp. L79 TaxID=3118402 RepID=UPI002F95EA6B
MHRMSVPALLMLATPVAAHDGLHHHPHGIEYGWVAFAVLAAAAGWVAARFWGRK